MGDKFLELIYSDLSRPKKFLDIFKEDFVHIHPYTPQA